MLFTIQFMKWQKTKLATDAALTACLQDISANSLANSLIFYKGTEIRYDICHTGFLLLILFLIFKNNIVNNQLDCFELIALAMTGRRITGLKRRRLGFQSNKKFLAGSICSQSRLLNWPHFSPSVRKSASPWREVGGAPGVASSLSLQERAGVRCQFINFHMLLLGFTQPTFY